MDNMEKTNPIGELMQTTMENVKNILKVDTVVGDPIYTPDGITLVPISRISVGFGGGGVEFGPKRKDGPQPYGGGNATGVKIEPFGFLIIKDGVVRMINVTPPANNTVDRIIDLVPQVIDRVDAFIEKQKGEGLSRHRLPAGRSGALLWERICRKDYRRSYPPPG